MIWLYLIIVVGLFIYYGKREFEDSKNIDCVPDENGSDVKLKLVTLVAKRNLNGGIYGSRTKYFVTFEFDEDKRREEFAVSGENYGLIADGDRGALSYQDTKFIGFERIVAIWQRCY